MIIGIGTDLVRIERLERALTRHGQRLIDRVLAPSERTAFEADQRSPAFLARRFAAKEAAAKALGTGIGADVRLTDVVVDHDTGGRPVLSLSGPAATRAGTLGVQRRHLSITDEREYAMAFVVLEGEGPPLGGEAPRP